MDLGCLFNQLVDVLLVGVLKMVELYSLGFKIYPLYLSRSRIRGEGMQLHLPLGVQHMCSELSELAS